MASSYSTNLAIELIGTGDQAGTWGVTTNTNLGTLIEQAISGYVTQAVSTGTDTTITIPNGSTGVARNMYIELTGTGGASTNLVVPAKKKLYFIYNNTASGQVTVKVAGQTGVSVPNGAKMILVNDGTDIVDATNYVGNISAASGNITTLTSSSATITNLIATTASVSDLSATVSRAGSATITNLIATTASVSDLSATVSRAGSATITNLTATSASVTNLTATSATISNFTFTSATVTRIAATSATVSDLSATVSRMGSATVTNLLATTASVSDLSATVTRSASATITNLIATTASVSDLSATVSRAGSATLTNLTSTSGTITTLVSSSATLTNLTATSASVTNLTATSATIDNFTFTSATVTRLAATSAVISDLSATVGRIGSATITNLIASDGSVTLTTAAVTSGNITTLTSASATITNLIATTGSVSDLSATVSRIGSGTITQLTSTSASITTLSGTSLGYSSGNVTVLTSDSATLTNLTSTSASITTLTATSASVTNLTATSLVLSNLSIASANVTTLTSASATITNLLATSLTVSSGSTLNGGVVVNETGADVDFRIESDTNANAFFLQGSDGFVGIGTAAPIDNLDVYGGITISTVDAFEVTGSDSATTQVVFQGFRGGDGVKTGTAIRIRSVGDGAGNANKAIFDTLDTERFRISDTEAVFNEPGADVDFRIESDTNTHAFFLQGSDGFVGVGTDSPADELHINTTGSNVNLRLTRDTDTGAKISASDGAGVPIIKFDTIASGTATERMVIDSSGNVLFYEDTGTTAKFYWNAADETLYLGDSTPGPAITTALLDIFGTSYTPVTSGHDTGGILLKGGTSGDGNYTPGIGFSMNAGGTNAGTAAIAGVQDTADVDTIGLSFFVHGSGTSTADASEAMRIDSSGNVGIGTSAATELLQINAAQPSDAGFKISSSGDGWVFKTAYVANNDIDLTISSENAGSSPVERLRIDSSGNVGIGTSSPETIFSLENFLLFDTETAAFPSSTYDTAAFIGRTASTGTAPFDQAGSLVYRPRVSSTAGRSSHIFYTGSPSAERLRIDESGNVGIGTSSPATQLVLSADNSGISAGTAPNNTLRFNDTDTILSTSQPTGRIEFYVNDATAGGTGVGSLIEGRSNGPDGGGTLIFQGSATGATGTLKNLLSLSGLSGIVFNNDGEDLDFRIESDTDENAFFVQGSDGYVGIGTDSPSSLLHLLSSTGDVQARVQTTFAGGDARLSLTGNSAGVSQIRFGDEVSENVGLLTYSHTDNSMAFRTNSADRMTIDSSGNVGIGTSSPDTLLHLSSTSGPVIRLERNDTSIVSPNSYGAIEFEGQDASTGASGVRGSVEGIAESSNGGMALVFSTAPSAGSNTERARLTNAGDFVVGKTAIGRVNVGFETAQSGITQITVDGSTPMNINRLTDDGQLIGFYQANSQEGSISVSGTTVSYNAFAGSHWSQLEDGSKPDILRGTVMESINELCVWPDETNERLPKCKISDTAGSKKVYGVFMAWDNDWETTNDMYVTAVGAFVCRVNAGVTVQEGDLLESNGDGTARVQADDIIRSSTIGKVTSTVKTHQYDDGSYCVPTVLYCG